MQTHTLKHVPLFGGDWNMQIIFSRENRDWSDWPSPPPKGNLREWEWEWEFTGNGKHATIPWPFANAIPRMAKGMTIAGFSQSSPVFCRSNLIFEEKSQKSQTSLKIDVNRLRFFRFLRIDLNKQYGPLPRLMCTFNSQRFRLLPQKPKNDDILLISYSFCTGTSWEAWCQPRFLGWCAPLIWNASDCRPKVQHIILIFYWYLIRFSGPALGSGVSTPLPDVYH